MALRSILPISSPWMAGGLASSRLLGGGTGTGKEGVCSRPLGAFAELADSTCLPRAAAHRRPSSGLTQKAMQCSRSRWHVPGAGPPPRASVFPSVQWEERFLLPLCQPSAH